MAADADAYLTWLTARPETAAAPVGVTGYCMGARLALLTAGTYPEKVAAMAGFHGALLATDDPAARTCSPRRSPRELRPRGQRLRHAAGAGHAPRGGSHRGRGPHSAEVYAGAVHGYTMADTEAYNPEAAERHWTAVLDLFGRNL